MLQSLPHPCICHLQTARLLSRSRLIAEMLRADGKDISKKASTRKGRYLMVFNFQLAPAAAGKLVRRVAFAHRWVGGPCRPHADVSTTALPAQCNFIGRFLLSPYGPLLRPPSRAPSPAWTARTRCSTWTSRRAGTSCLVGAWVAA